jgi:hypothetical protein
MTRTEPQEQTETLLNQVLRWPTARSREWTRTFVCSARDDSNIIAIVAIGSAVRPNVSSTDIDLLALCISSRSIRQAVPIEVDLRSYSSDGIEHKIASGHDLITWSIKFGRVLYQREDYWSKLVSSWASRIPLPSPKVARERAVVVYRHFTEFLDLGDELAAREQATSYVTHLIRAELIERGEYPASRPELPEQLRASVGASNLADNLDLLLSNDTVNLHELSRLFATADTR